MEKPTIWDKIDEAKPTIITIAVIVLIVFYFHFRSVAQEKAQEEHDKYVAQDTLENDAIDYVHEKYYISDVYSKEEIEDYMFDYDSDYMKDFVADWCEIEDVFTDDIILDYVGENYYYELNWIFTDSQIQEYAHDFYNPEDIYTEEELLEWYKDYTEKKK